MAKKPKKLIISTLGGGLHTTDEAFQNAKKNTPGAATIEHDKALERVMLELLKDRQGFQPRPGSEKVRICG